MIDPVLMPDGVIKNFRRQGQLWAALQ